MKRIFAVIILLTAGIAVFAQQANTTRSSRPTSEQTKSNAKQYADQANSNASQFASTQTDLNARNVSNDDARYFNQLKGEIERLEAQIVAEQNKISATQEKGIKVSQETLDNVQKLIDKHNEKVTELQTFASSSTSSK